MFDEAVVRDLVGALVTGEEEPHDAVALIDRVADADRVIAHLQARQLADMAAFADLRRRGRAAAWPEHAGEITHDGVNDELGLARGISPVTAACHLHLGQVLLRDFPCCFAALAAGEIGLHAARVIVAETDVLTPEQRRVTDEAVALEAMRLTPGQVREAVRARVLAADPQAAHKRAAKARQDVRVGLVRKPDGMGMVFAVLPAEQALGVFQSLDQHARAQRQGGDERSLQRLRGDCLVARVTGLVPGSATEQRGAKPGVRLNVVISAATLLGLDDHPAVLSGYGAITPAVLADILADADTWVRRMFTDPVDGQVLTIDSRARKVEGLLRTFVRARDGHTCRRPYCTNPIRDVDHIHQYAQHGRTNAANSDGLCQPCHLTRHRLGWTLEADADGTRVWWTTPTGHSYASDPPPALGYGTLEVGMLRMLVRHHIHRRPAA